MKQLQKLTPETLQQFQDEVNVMVQLRHPNIIQVRNIGLLNLPGMAWHRMTVVVLWNFVVVSSCWEPFGSLAEENAQLVSIVATL